MAWPGFGKVRFPGGPDTFPETTLPLYWLCSEKRLGRSAARRPKIRGETGGAGRAKAEETIAQNFKGLVYVKHGQVGSKSEGPLYFLQTYNAEFLLEYQERRPWDPDYHLEFYCRRMVEVKGKLIGRVIHVEEISEILSPRIPKPGERSEKRSGKVPLPKPTRAKGSR